MKEIDFEKIEIDDLIVDDFSVAINAALQLEEQTENG